MRDAVVKRALPLVDSHCHIDFPELAKNLSGVLDRMRENGVGLAVCAGVSIEGFPQILELAQENPQLLATVGVHPEHTEGHDPTQAELVALAQAPEVIAIGETGLDYHHGQRNDFVPRQLFRQMLALARTHHLPVIVHSRDADEEILKELTEHAADWNGAPDAIGVLHCFTGGPEYAIRLLDLGFYISFSGILTFRKAEDIRTAAAIVPEDRLLLETDAPFLAPEPFRGLRNEPFMLVSTAFFLAEIRGQSIEEIAECTTANAHRLFRPRWCHHTTRENRMDTDRIEPPSRQELNKE